MYLVQDDKQIVHHLREQREKKADPCNNDDTHTIQWACHITIDAIQRLN